MNIRSRRIGSEDRVFIPYRFNGLPGAVAVFIHSRPQRPGHCGLKGLPCQALGSLFPSFWFAHGTLVYQFKKIQLHRLYLPANPLTHSGMLDPNKKRATT